MKQESYTAAKCAHAPMQSSTTETALAQKWTVMVTASPAKDNIAGISDKRDQGRTSLTLTNPANNQSLVGG